MTNANTTNTNVNDNASTSSLPSYNECRYAYIDVKRNCHSDRNCADCLKQKGCRIATGGFCEPDTNLTNPQTDALNYKRGIVVGNVSLANDKSDASTVPQKWRFPAAQVTYCSGDDAVCNQCTEDNYGTGSDISDSRFCVGKGGCVCVLNCKSSFLEVMTCESTGSHIGDERVVDGDTKSTASPISVNPTPANQVTETQEPLNTSAAVWIVPVVGVVVVGVVVGFVWRRMRARRASQPNHCAFQTPVVETTGTKAM